MKIDIIKRLLITLLVVVGMAALFSDNLSAQDWLDPIMDIQLGYSPDRQMEAFYDPSTEKFLAWDVVPQGSFNLDIKVGAILWDFLWVEGEIDTLMLPLDSFGISSGAYSGSFSPFQNDYGARAGIDFVGFRLGVEHWCYHPVMVLGEKRVEKYGGKNKVFLEYSLERARNK